LELGSAKQESRKPEILKCRDGRANRFLQHAFRAFVPSGFLDSIRRHPKFLALTMHRGPGSGRAMSKL